VILKLEYLESINSAGVKETAAVINKATGGFLRCAKR
jgi:hypothetical protein